MSDFYVGQKVVCVDVGIDPKRPNATCWLGDKLEKDAIYTIEAFGPLSLDTQEETLILVEAKNSPLLDFSFRAARFRPLESKAMKLFRKIAQDVTDGKVVEIV